MSSINFAFKENIKSNLIELVEDMVHAKLQPQLSNLAYSTKMNRLYFLVNDGTPSIQYVSIPNDDDHLNKPLEATKFLTDQNLAQRSELSKEEQLRRERMRASTASISSFKIDEDSYSILIPSSDIYVANEKTAKVVEMTTTIPGSRVDVNFSPGGRYISFIRHNDIWIQELESMTETRLTFSNPDDSPSCRKASGVAEYIMQEEFDRYTGYYWHKDNFDKYKIVFAEIDETEVHTYHIPEPGITGSVDKFTYPLVGQKNADFALGYLDIVVQNGVPTVVKKMLSPSIKKIFPWAEYMPRFGWAKNGTKIWAQLLDRKQQHFVVALFELSQFKENTSEEDPTPEATIIWEETTDIWININDCLTFLSNGNFIIASEKTGFRHLYLNEYNSPGNYTVKTLTQGEWQVETSQIWVDEESSNVYFHGTKDGPLENHFYGLCYAAETPTPIRLTLAGHFHNVLMDVACQHFVTTYSNVREPHKMQLFRVAHNKENTSSPSSVATVVRPITPIRPSKFELNPPDIFNFTNSHKLTCYGCYFKPKNFDPSIQYPCVLYTYGGPHVQLVKNDYELTLRYLNLQLWSQLGYLVVIVDGVGSWRRGLHFEGFLRNQMGQVEVQEQIDGLHFLIKQGFVDTNRIAVTGWSYGGYMSLMCLAQRPDFFKVAVSGAPVTMWEAYDTGYTERYMDTAENNPEGYQKGSVLHYVRGFPDEPHRLMLIHGAIDENVHLCNTLQLINAFVEAGKPYDLQIFPKDRHGVRSSIKAMKQHERTVIRYLVDHL